MENTHYISLGQHHCMVTSMASVFFNKLKKIHFLFKWSFADTLERKTSMDCFFFGMII